MKNLQISEEKAKELYTGASKEFKVLLEETFGKKLFLGDVKDRIDSWEDMMREANRPDVPEFHELPEDMRDHFKKYYKAVVMTEAYNEGKKMDIYNKNKYRHYPYFETNGSPSGFRFYYSICGASCAIAGSGSRLSFEDENISNHAGIKHTDIYRDMLES